MENNIGRRYAQEKRIVGERRPACENESHFTQEIIVEIIRAYRGDFIGLRILL